jgi:carbonic anhydrase/acetyltransferase-like protein (isoleucine patch superfamily)
LPNGPRFIIPLIIDDDAVIGPGAMIHGYHIGRGSIDHAAGGSP